MADVAELALPGAQPAARRRPRLGYALVAGSAALFALNGVVAKVLLTDGGLSAERLTELRTTGAFAGLALALLVVSPGRLRLGRAELPLLAFYGIVGFALVQWLYFVAIARLPIGIALLLEFTAPVLVALWARFVWRERVRRRVWGALALSLAGLALVGQVWSGFTLDGVGVAAALAAAAALAVYFLVGEHSVARRDPFSLVCLALGFSALFWALVLPWWSFPFHALDKRISPLGTLEGASAPVWLLALWLIVAGTIVPFALSLSALRHLPATRVAVVAMLEPPLATLVAWALLGEALAPAQLAGGGITLAGILLAQTAR